MPTPSFIAAELAEVGNDDNLSVSMTAALAAASEGDLLLAIVVLGDTTLGTAGIPVDAAGDPLWVRVTGAAVIETGPVLEGELLMRRHAGDDEPDEHTFGIEQDVGSGLTNEASIGVAILAFTDVDLERPIRIYGETAAASGTNHVTPDVTPAMVAGETALLVAAHFLWADAPSAAPDGAMTSRASQSTVATGGGADRSVALLVADEVLAAPGATGTRTATTAASMTSNDIALVLGSNELAEAGLDAFNIGLGSDQGRLAPQNYTPPEGSFAFVLGSDLEDQLHDLNVGDFVEAEQTADFDTTTIARVTVRTRAPATMPAGLGWKFSLRIDGAERASAILEPDDDLVRDREFAANVSQLSGDHILAVRLELVNV
jgi:hypothetical protein